MNKLIQAISLLWCFMVTGSVSAMKISFVLTNNKGAAKRFRLVLGKRERPIQSHEHSAAELGQEVVVQPTSLKKQKPSIDAKKVYSAIRSKADPVWIHQVYKRLYAAIDQGNVARAQNILGFSGMDWNVLVGPLKMTCLHRAVLHGNVDIARLLIEKGARLDLPMANGKTALDIAIERGHFGMLYLVAHGETPKIFAEQNKQEDAVGYFQPIRQTVVPCPPSMPLAQELVVGRK